MEVVDFSKPGEKKKLILAGALGFIAILFLWWTFIGFGSGTVSPPKNVSAIQTISNRSSGNHHSNRSGTSEKYFCLPGKTSSCTNTGRNSDADTYTYATGFIGYHLTAKRVCKNRRLYPGSVRR